MNELITDCYDKIILEKYLNKEVSPYKQLEITNHLIKCDRCLDIVIDLYKQKKNKGRN